MKKIVNGVTIKEWKNSDKFIHLSHRGWLADREAGGHEQGAPEENLEDLGSISSFALNCPKVWIGNLMFPALMDSYLPFYKMRA